MCVFASFAFAAEAFAVNPITDEGKFLSDPAGDGVTPRTTTVPIRMPLTTGRQAVRIAFFTANGGTFGSLESITFK